MVTDVQTVVAAFLEGMYYAGDLPSRAERYDITRWLTKHQLKGLDIGSVEQAVSEQLDVLHQRVHPIQAKEQ